MRDDLRLGAVLLCGGKSSRMGRPKHLLPFGEEVVLQRVIRILSNVVDQIAVVAAPEQELPELPANCQMVRDQITYEGPLSGLSYGLSAIAEDADAVYLSGCDVPLLRPEFVSHMFSRLGDAEIAVPYDQEFLHPLAAVYRTSLHRTVTELLQQGERRPRRLIESARSNLIPVATLRDVDPDLDSLKNMNTPEDYAELRQRFDQ